MDLRQSKSWSNFISQIGWSTEKLGSSQIFIRKIPLLPYSILKLQRPANPPFFPKLDQLAKDKRAVCIILEPDNVEFQEKEILAQGFQQAPQMSLLHTSTILIDLNQTEERLLSSFSENARRNIKKSQNNNLKVEKIFLRDDLNHQAFDKFYQLLLNLQKMKECYIPSKSEIFKKMGSFRNNSLLLFATPQSKSEAVAAVWLGFFEETAVYLHTGNTAEGYELLANYLLVWEALKAAQELKLKIFDFEGIYDPRFPKYRRSWKNFTEFKKRFHGQIVEYPPAYVKCYNIWFKLLFLCSKVLSR